MKKILILLLAISLFNCSKDEISEPDYSGFLGLRTERVMGEVDTYDINWRREDFSIQIGYGFGMGNEVCSPTNPIRILMFSFSHKTDDDLKQFVFVTPPMDTSDETDVNTVFGIGEKQVGEIYKDFYISFRKGDEFYKSTSNTTDKLEILKTEEFIDDDNRTRLLVWIKVDSLVLENHDDSGENIELKNMLLVVNLWGHKFE